jgi:hypothetical protein
MDGTIPYLIHYFQSAFSLHYLPSLLSLCRYGRVSCYTRDSPLLVSSAAEAYKPSAKPHFLYFRHNLYQFYPHILKPSYMPNTALFMQLSGRGTELQVGPSRLETYLEVAVPEVLDESVFGLWFYV